MNRLGLLDADVLVHRISRAAENKVRWPNGMWTWYATEEDASFILDRYLAKIKEQAEITEFVYCLSSETNYRHEIFPDYKKDRDNPMSYPPILKEFLRDTFRSRDCFEIKDLEADDVMGILMTDQWYKPEMEKVIITIDKDLDTIPGAHFNLDSREFYYKSESESDYFFYQQILTGDRIDGIPGIPGFGEKTARKLLDKFPRDQWWDEIVKAYKKHTGDEANALLNARMVRILRSSDWDRANKAPIMWCPEKLNRETSTRRESRE